MIHCTFSSTDTPITSQTIEDRHSEKYFNMLAPLFTVKTIQSRQFKHFFAAMQLQIESFINIHSIMVLSIVIHSQLPLKI